MPCSLQVNLQDNTETKVIISHTQSSTNDR